MPSSLPFPRMPHAHACSLHFYRWLISAQVELAMLSKYLIFSSLFKYLEEFYACHELF